MSGGTFQSQSITTKQLATDLMISVICPVIPVTFDQYDQYYQNQYKNKRKQLEDRTNKQMEAISIMKQQQAAFQAKLEIYRQICQENLKQAKGKQRKIQNLSHEVYQKRKERLKIERDRSVHENSFKGYENEKYTQLYNNEQFEEETDSFKEEENRARQISKYCENIQTFFQVNIEKVKICLGQEIKTGIDKVSAVVLDKISSAKPILLNNLLDLKLKVEQVKAQAFQIARN